MRVDEALRRLQPLVPRSVTSWRDSLVLVDGSTRQLLEQHILATAREHLGEAESKILLPPPPRKKAEGRIVLGTVVYPKTSYPFGLGEAELLQGLGIYGRSGSGKTNVVFNLLLQLAARGIPFLFLDWKRTCRHLLPHIGQPVNVYTPGRRLAPLTFNPLIPPPGLEERVHITQLVDVLSSAYTLGDGARSIVQKALYDAYDASDSWPDLEEVLAIVDKRVVKGRAVGWKASSMRALEGLAFADLLGGEKTDQDLMVERLLANSTVIELDGLNVNAKKFLVPVLMSWLFQYRIGRPDRERLRLVVIIEEAHHLLYRQEQRAEESIMNRMLRQCRELGIGMVVVDQHPHLISSAALGNMYTSICLNLKEPTDVSRAAALSSVRNEDKRYLGMLPVGEGIVKLQDRWPEPFLVRFPDVSVNKGAVTDAVLRSSLERKGTRSAWNTPPPILDSRVRRVRLADDGIPEDGRRLLLDCLAHPIDGVRVRYKRLGLSADRGGRAKRQLHQYGLAESAEIPIGRTRRLVLRPTREARRMLRLDARASPESVEHEFWKHYHAEKLSKAGFQVELEAPRRGGRVDVLGRTRTERVAIEVETGKSNTLANVRNCLRSRFDKIVVVATNAETMSRIEEQLARRSLLLRGRVAVVLRENQEALDTARV